MYPRGWGGAEATFVEAKRLNFQRLSTFVEDDCFLRNVYIYPLRGGRTKISFPEMLTTINFNSIKPPLFRVYEVEEWKKENIYALDDSHILKYKG
jgi:hypothetical protein